MKTFTASALETAVRNAAKMNAQGYTIKPSVAVPSSFAVVKPGTGGKLYYIVDTTPGYEFCQCEQYNREGVCKHQKFVCDYIADTEAANDYADYEAFGKYL